MAIEQGGQQSTIYEPRERHVVRRWGEPADGFVPFDQGPEVMPNGIQATAPEAMREIVGIEVLYRHQ